MFPADTTFTVFDIETTGLDPAKDRIVEIAGVRICQGAVHPEQSFVSLVNPQRAIAWEARSIHRIQEKELAAAPPIEEVLPHFLAFAEGTQLVAHNADFDRGFLEAEKEGCWGYIEIPACLCTLTLSRAVHPQAHRHTLEAVGTRLGLSSSSTLHRALPDVILAARVFLELLKAGNIRSWEELRRKAAPPLSVRVRASARGRDA